MTERSSWDRSRPKKRNGAGPAKMGRLRHTTMSNSDLIRFCIIYTMIPLIVPQKIFPGLQYFAWASAKN